MSRPDYRALAATLRKYLTHGELGFDKAELVASLRVLMEPVQAEMDNILDYSAYQPVFPERINDQELCGFIKRALALYEVALNPEAARPAQGGRE